MKEEAGEFNNLVTSLLRIRNRRRIDYEFYQIRVVLPARIVCRVQHEGGDVHLGG